MYDEIVKVQRRLPRWLKKLNQYNSQILYAFVELSARSYPVRFDDLEKKLANSHFKGKFKGNFDQMRNFGSKNHGKIFEVDAGFVYWWEPIKDFALEQLGEAI
ncbi:MAG: hypothetical protein LBV04_07915 [Deferribacteraceae bacterium]|jgi:hypothetical protein|nr:hypothetical protein [Deferribacteraceae bacterium]